MDRAADGFELSRVEIGDTRPDEIADAIAVAARALADGPLTVAVVGPDLDRCYRQLHRFFTLQYRLAPNQMPMVARLDGRVVASANAMNGGGCHATPLMKLLALGLLWAYLHHSLAGLRHLGLDPRTVVVELNRQLIRRPRLADTALANGDAVELVHFVGGG